MADYTAQREHFTNLAIPFYDLPCSNQSCIFTQFSKVITLFSAFFNILNVNFLGSPQIKAYLSVGDLTSRDQTLTDKTERNN